MTFKKNAVETTKFIAGSLLLLQTQEMAQAGLCWIFFCQIVNYAIYALYSLDRSPHQLNSEFMILPLFLGQSEPKVFKFPVLI